MFMHHHTLIAAQDISRASLPPVDAHWEFWPFASWHLTSNARTPQQARVRVSAARDTHPGLARPALAGVVHGRAAGA